MGHGQLFKELLRTFLREFLELFLPDIAARLDFESLSFPNKELFKGFPDGRLREPDVVAELRSQDGEREIVLVQVEVQAEPETDFGKRMFEYYALLWLHLDAAIVPVVLHLKRGDPKGIDIVEYRHALF
jgi:predicted transposase/invertase (TIGR01784 family)